MKRSYTALALCALLSACGGGGGGTTPPLNRALPVTHSASVTFVLKVPPAAKQFHAHRNVKRMYVSPSTLGVGIAYAVAPATFSTAQLKTPQVAFDLTTCGSGCTANSDGSKTYTLNAPIPGSVPQYSIQVDTWDSAPVSGTFSGNMLSQQYLASIAVPVGSASTSVTISLDAIPVSLAFTPVAGQSHVQPNAGGWAIIGNAPVQFALNALDADGFTIASSDPGAPSMAINDSTHQFTFSPLTGNLYSVQAVSAASGTASVSLTATAPPLSGIAPYSTTAALTPVQEVWSSTTAGGPPAGLLGYPIYPVSNEPSTSAIDYLAISTTNYNIRQPAFDSHGNIFLNNTPSSGSPPAGIYELTQNGFSLAPSFVNASTPFIGIGTATQFNSLAIDSSDDIITIASSGGSGYGGVAAYSSGGSPLAQQNSSGSDSIAYGSDVAIAPANVDSGTFKDYVFVAGYFGIGMLSPSPHLTLLSPTITPAVSSLQGITFDANGYLWTHDGGSLYVYSVTGSASSPVLTQVASASSAGTFTSGMGRTAQGTVWIPEGATTPYATEWKMTCSPVCSISQVGSTFSTAATNFSMVVVP